MPSSRSSSYSIIEPHPSIPPTQRYITTGRGGAGNAHRTPSTITRGSEASGPPSRLTSSTHKPSPPSTFSTGRGGAGNIKHAPSERAIFSFDEELEREMRSEAKAPVYHAGRGGAGNVVSAMPMPMSSYARRKSDESDGSSARSSSSGAESGADVATRKIREGWRKMVGLESRNS